jgi:ABC-type lipoprotein export system ATPase subunit
MRFQYPIKGKTMETKPFVWCENLIKIYQAADLEVVALQGLDLALETGEMMALIGPSGSGKSTLLNVIGGLDTPSAGSVWVAGWDLLKMDDRERVRYKRQVVGFAWQQPGRNLLPYLSARENVVLPMLLQGTRTETSEQKALELLSIVGLSERADFRPDRLSGGEQQRVALAVAMANNPPLLLGDELTGQVDSESAMQILTALRAVNQAYGTTVLLVTHDPLVASQMDRVVSIRDGRTTTEIRHRYEQENLGNNEKEWVLLDRMGRLQLPQAYLSTLAMRERVRLHLEPDHISVWPQAPDLPSERVDEPPPPSWDLRSVQDEQRLDSGVSVSVTNLTRIFELAGKKVHALREVNLEFRRGSLTVIKGPSGSGKTTLLNLIAGLDEPSAGAVSIEGRSLAKLSPGEMIELRRQQIGFVFQTFGLLSYLSVDENVQVPLRLLSTSRQERQARVDEALEMVGLSDRASHRIHELSGGEQQRVAIARALVKRPRLLLADEPTGQLDTLTGASIIALLRDIAIWKRVTVVVASHDPNVHESADRIFELGDGRLVPAASP